MPQCNIVTLDSRSIVMPEISVNVEGRLNEIGMDGGTVRGIYKHGREDVNGM